MCCVCNQTWLPEKYLKSQGTKIFLPSKRKYLFIYVFLFVCLVCVKQLIIVINSELYYILFYNQVKVFMYYLCLYVQSSSGGNLCSLVLGHGVAELLVYLLGHYLQLLWSCFFFLVVICQRLCLFPLLFKAQYVVLTDHCIKLP